MRVDRVMVRFPGPVPFTLGPLDVEGPEDRPWLILGPAGSGKSTLLRILGGGLRPDSGRILGPTADGSAYLPQRPERALSGRNLAEDLSGQLRPDAATRSRLRAAMAEIGLEGIPLSRRSRDLSAGERRRLSLALLDLAPRRDWALDEPDAGLDREGRERFLGWLTGRLPGRRVWIATHRWDLYRSLAGFALVLVRGRLLAAGDPVEVLAAPEVREALAGEGGGFGRVPRVGTSFPPADSGRPERRGGDAAADRG